MHAWEAIQKAVDSIEENLEQELSPEKRPKAAALSPFYFQRLFARLVKRPVNEYVKMRRLAEVCTILGGKENGNALMRARGFFALQGAGASSGTALFGGKV